MSLGSIFSLVLARTWEHEWEMDVCLPCWTLRTSHSEDMEGHEDGDLSLLHVTVTQALSVSTSVPFNGER